MQLKMQFRHQHSTNMITAPNTPGREITREGPYHNITRGTVSSSSDHSPSHCRRCKMIPDYDKHEYSHVVNGPGCSLRVFCEEHCPTCVEFKKSLKSNSKE